jgi:septal ring factor EnvC (AmiA/AmiB activator)
VPTEKQVWVNLRLNSIKLLLTNGHRLPFSGLRTITLKSGVKYVSKHYRGWTRKRMGTNNMETEYDEILERLEGFIKETEKRFKELVSEIKSLKLEIEGLSRGVQQNRVANDQIKGTLGSTLKTLGDHSKGFGKNA